MQSKIDDFEKHISQLHNHEQYENLSLSDRLLLEVENNIELATEPNVKTWDSILASIDTKNKAIQQKLDENKSEEVSSVYLSRLLERLYFWKRAFHFV